jgi:hypothetical protein
LVLGLLFLTPYAAFAQSATTGAIAGVVKDMTGAVLPGVTVEASSPALIEKVRSAVTDGQGNYKIIDLRPGTYAVTFTLAGFGVVKREGIELTTGFTAAVNAELKVGSLGETITVTGESPVVDVQNIRTQSVLSQAALDALPVAKNLQSYAAITVGATLAAPQAQDVGGSGGEQFTEMLIHGSRGGQSRMKLDGMIFNNMQGSSSGSSRQFFINDAMVQEITLETSGVSAESEVGGIQLNVVPREGANRFSLLGKASYTGDGFQSSNLSDSLIARGVTSAASTRKVYDYSIGVGGPVKRDRLWFYTANRWWGSQQNAPGKYFNKTQGTPFYTPDPTRQAYTDFYFRDNGLRLTWQAAQKHKFTFSDNYEDSCNCRFFSTSQPLVMPEADILAFYKPINVAQGTWSYPATNRLLFEAGAMNLINHAGPQPMPGVTPNDISITDVGLGIMYNALVFGLRAGQYGNDFSYGQSNGRAAVSYVTGSHAFKAGVFMMSGEQVFNTYINQALNYTFRFQTPISLTEWASPHHDAEQVDLNLGLYGQDQWTTGRMTLNLGVRFDSVNAEVPAQQRPAGRFVGAFDFPAIKNVPAYKDLSPRLGAAYDLFGNGKTAVKFALGRYVNAMGADIASIVNPALAISLSATRTWSDANGNFVPDCNLQNPAANGECGALNNSKFGTVNVVTHYDPALLSGFGTREYNWQTSASVQQELRPGVAVNVGYFRTWYGNFTTTENRAVTSQDFNPYCITAPVDARLPGGGGNTLCGLYDVAPAKFGQVDNLITHTSNFGNQSEVFNGFDISVNARLGEGRLIQGGISTGQKVTDTCLIVDTPQLARPGFCKVTPPWSAGTQMKISAAYPLPWGFSASATYQNLPGIPISASYVASNAQIAPSLGRNLAAGAAGTATIDLIPPQSMFEDRLNQVDLRFLKTFVVRTVKLQAMFDLYNVLNANTVLLENATYGASWLKPTQILGGRLLKFGAQITF